MARNGALSPRIRRFGGIRAVGDGLPGGHRGFSWPSFRFFAPIRARRYAFRAMVRVRVLRGSSVAGSGADVLRRVVEPPHGSALEGYPVSVVEQPVEDGVAEGWIADDIVPVVDGDLAGEQRAAAGIAVVEDLKEVVPALAGEGRRAPSRRGGGRRGSTGAFPPPSLILRVSFSAATASSVSGVTCS